MGWVEEQIDSDGRVRYKARYRDLRGRKRSAGSYSTERQADRAWQRAEAQIEIGRIGDPRRGRQTLETYVREEWLPNHVVEITTRDGYVGQLERYILPEFGRTRMIDILPSHVREWVVRLQTVLKKEPPTIRQCKVILDAILTTALNDQIVFLHAGKGVRTPPVAKKPKRIITGEQFDQIYQALGDPLMRLLVETDIETGLRWGELVELRPKDIDFSSGVITVARVVVQRRSKLRDGEQKFVIKNYPKDKEWRQMLLPQHLLEKLKDHIATVGIGQGDLLFEFKQPLDARRRTVPDSLPDPDELGRTEPNSHGRSYQHGTMSAYTAGKCRCRFCRDAMAFYRASRRSSGKDSPRQPRTVHTDGHMGNDWFRRNVWNKATAIAQLPMRVTPHSLRHAHASWLLAGGADLQVVKERLGHGSISTTEQYLHTLPGAGEAALAAMSAFRGGATRNATSATSPVAKAPSPIELIGQLAALRDAGALDATEFEVKKAELLGRI